MDYLVYKSAKGNYCEFMGPSTASKPTEGFDVGVWVETNTGKAYLFDKTNGWTEA